ncbi:gamma-glutamylcyclotransferase family protein [Desulfogranum marinum]|uniref:gamma-glutamylcyclotransferase family protein n=1 Tax=Desulfogranum marinum TaxID=453220 RepID=UPI001965BEC7|nr:gamma-glutamylcyclotransferase family protein [Desulfogranum marinum]MBM9514691.1 gamma-glutamylcyclotransferase [Desulfogranum marinum]
MKSHNIFVYGTLKRGYSNHRFLADSKFLGTGKTREKYAMYVSGIPFVIVSEPVSQIHGELYEVDDQTLYKLDQLEGHPHWYQREQVEICLDNNFSQSSTVTAWIYFNEDNSGTLVPTGCFSLKPF